MHQGLRRYDRRAQYDEVCSAPCFGDESQRHKKNASVQVHGRAGKLAWIDGDCAPTLMLAMLVMGVPCTGEREGMIWLYLTACTEDTCIAGMTKLSVRIAIAFPIYQSNQAVSSSMGNRV